jgi:predicted phage gp36 major capsid-like protein
MTTATLTREQQLVEEQNKLWNRMQEIMRAAEEEGRDLSAEERTNWDQAEVRLNEVSKDIERIQRHSQLSTIDRSQHIDTGANTAQPEAAALT